MKPIVVALALLLAALLLLRVHEPFSGGRYAVQEIPGVLEPHEARALIEAAKGKFARSTVVGAKGPSSTRTSQTAWMNRANAGAAWPIVEKIRRAAARLTGITDMTKYEDLQMVRYEDTEMYSAHFDAALALTPGNTKIRRVATFIVYLNDGFEGGETSFPKLDLKVVPVTGKGVLFYNLDSNDEEHAMSLHESLPVTRGVKYAVQQWIR